MSVMHTLVRIIWYGLVRADNPVIAGADSPAAAGTWEDNVRRNILSAAIFAAATTAALPVLAQSQPYPLLGEEIANYARETDRFTVGERRGPFTELKLRVERGSVRVFGIVVIFGNGQKREYGRDRVIEPGKAGYTIDLPGRARRIKHVDVTYRTLRRSSNRRAVVSLLGQSVVVRDPDYERIASINADLRNDSFVIDVPRRGSRFEAIKIGALHRDVFLRRIVIAHRNGDLQTVRIDDWLDEGRTTPRIEIAKPRRSVRSVTIVTRSGRTRDVVKFDLFAKRTPGSDADDRRFGPRPRVDRSGEPIGYDRLGRIRVLFAGAVGRLEVGRGAGRMNSLALRAEGNDVFIRSVRVTYGNGQRDQITVERPLREDRVSPTILLDGARFVRFIEFEAQTKRGPGRTRLRVYGALDDRRRPGSKPDRKPKWVNLGARRPRRFRSERHVIEIGRDAGRFKAIRLSIEKHDVRFKGMRVIFGNGSEQDIPFYAKVDDGVTTNPFSLESKGRGRFIQRIIVQYNTTANFKGSALVQFWGLRE